VNAYYDRWVTGCTEVMESFAPHLPDLRLLLVSVYSKLKDVYADPLQYGFTRTSIAALDDPLLIDKSFAGPGADYLFWDASHPTSKTHKLIARWHSDALTNAVLETVESSLSAGSLNLQMSHLLIGRDYTLQTSIDLTNWNDVQTFTASAGTNQVSQALAIGTSSVFYRLQWQP
jgi:phospholipase/lecithinase/hemolysin